MFCSTRLDAELTFDVLRYGDMAKNIPPFLGEGARPFGSSSEELSGSFPDFLSLSEMIVLGGGRNRGVKVPTGESPRTIRGLND